MTAFVDFIRISQRHPGHFNPDTLELEAALPLVDAGIIGKYGYDAETCEASEDPEWVMSSKLKLRGSFDSMIIVRCDGYKIELEGNVGRFNRVDNVFNLDFDSTIAKCNEILALFDLPPFTAGEQVLNTNPSDYDVRHGLFEQWTGASISELHLTQNYECGSMANAQAVIDWLSTQSLSRVKRGRAGETSVQWGSKAGRKLLKAYLKAPEMLAHKHGRKAEHIQSDPVYRYCQEQGVLRLEFEAKRLTLRDHNLRYLGDITMDKLNALYNAEARPILDRAKADVSRIELEHLPANVRMTAAAYLRGENVRAIMARATFFRHAKVLREYGIDIAEPLANVTSSPICIKVVEIKAVSEPPAWYWNHQRRMSDAAANSDEAKEDLPVIVPGRHPIPATVIRATGTDDLVPPRLRYTGPAPLKPIGAAFSGRP